jgi:hypothetical protein
MQRGRLEFLGVKGKDVIGMSGNGLFRKWRLLVFLMSLDLKLKLKLRFPLGLFLHLFDIKLLLMGSIILLDLIDQVLNFFLLLIILSVYSIRV